MSNAIKKIGIVIYEYGFGYSAPVVNTAFALEHEGYEVQIFVDTASFERGSIDVGNKNIRIHAIDARENEAANQARSSAWKTSARALISRGAGRILEPRESRARDISLLAWAQFYRTFYDRGALGPRLRKQMALFLPELLEFSEKLAWQIKGEDFVCLVAINVLALIAATAVVECTPQLKQLPIIYYSMELLPDARIHSPTVTALKSLERSCAQASCLTVIQDKARAKHFIKATQVPQEKLAYVPVSGLREPYRGTNNYFRKLFNISKDEKILLHAGRLAPDGMCLELAEAARAWADDLVLVLHNAASGYVDNAYLDKLKRAAPENKVYLSLNPVGWHRVPELISSADIGLLFFSDWSDPNWYEIALSSNKLVQYLQVGLPIISIDFLSLKGLMEECRCGETTHSPEGIEAQARKIFSDYQTYRNNAFTCYDKKYRMSLYFDSVLETIRQLE